MATEYGLSESSSAKLKMNLVAPFRHGMVMLVEDRTAVPVSVFKKYRRSGARLVAM